MSDAAAGLVAPPPPRQPIFNIPAVIQGAIALLLGVHLVRQVIPEQADDRLFGLLAFVPGRLSFSFMPDRVIESVVALAGQGPEGYRQAQAGRYFLGDYSAQPWTLVSYALLHADWGHVGLNSIWLLAFGTPIARRFGAVRFVLLMVVTALAGGLVHWIAHPVDLAPVIGASAAVSGCMGATLRFMFQPRVPVAAMLGTSGEDRRQLVVQPAQPMREVLRDRRAVTFIAAWFATNLLFGLGSISFGAANGPIAWEAHIGGFLAGLLLFRLFDPVGGHRAMHGGPPPLAPDGPMAGL